MLKHSMEGQFHADYLTPDHLQHLHDHCLVWTSQVQGLAAVGRDSGELRVCLRRVLFLSAGESHRT